MFHDKNKEENDNIWYLDNGASNHMTRYYEKFQSLDETFQIMGKGTVVFICNNGGQKVFQEVYYILKLCTNIISLGPMTEDENEAHMVRETMKVLDRSKKLLMMVK